MHRIFDAVYGYVQLNDVEFRLVTSPIFQRLHWIKQLGPLNIVFPSAQHSRFSHSIGVFHIVKKMIDHLDKRTDRYQYPFKGDDKKALKLAALLHDVGHVPLSHIGEEVLTKTFVPEIQELMIETFDKGKQTNWRNLFPEQYLGGSTKLHEALSAEIVLNDREVDEILSMEHEGWPDPLERKREKGRIAQIIVGKNSNDIPTLLLHSELDADRLDFLLRDSFFTGVDYGKIDLDYIISRLGATKKRDDPLPHLCVEKKGLHTVEHYILGRFFLQTQIIYNRRVRFIDLLWSEVMEYMVRNKEQLWGLMDLSDLVKHIRHEEGDARGHLHEIYAYTDAEVFWKMRKLHEELDEKGKSRKATTDELYINDCVKIIMDGQVPDAVATHQRLVNLGNISGENFRIVVEDEANQIAKVLAKNLGVDRRRVKENVVMEEAMKYKPRMRGDEEANREAVKIMYRLAGENDEIIPAVESNASILRGLGDRALVIFNVYYVPEKHEAKPKIREKENDIKKAYQQFISEHFQARTIGCGCVKGPHMCQIVQEADGIEKVRKLSKGAKYICERCGRISSRKQDLCNPGGI